MTENYFDWLPSRMAAKKFNTLFDAISKGTINDVDAMIAAGADLNARKYGMTPLM